MFSRNPSALRKQSSLVQCNDFVFYLFLYLGLGRDSLYINHRAVSTSIKLLPNPTDLIFYGDGCTTLRIYKTQWVVAFKWVNYMIWELYLNKVVIKNVSVCSFGWALGTWVSAQRAESLDAKSRQLLLKQTYQVTPVRWPKVHIFLRKTKRWCVLVLTLTKKRNPTKVQNNQ